MIRPLRALSAVLLVPLLASAADRAPPQRELPALAQRLLDAIGRGDRAVFERHVDDACLFTDETGRVLTKPELIAEITPLPPGHEGRLELTEPKVRVFGEVATLSHRDIERLSIHGVPISARYQATETWRRRDGEWKLVASQVTALLAERKPGRVEDPGALDSYVGRYALAPGFEYEVTREGDRLYVQRTGRAREELVPWTPDVFYVSGTVRGEKVFERDERGRVVRLLDRRENVDLTWQRLPGSPGGR
jgi:ketosteroid isomerase-like protein